MANIIQPKNISIIPTNKTANKTGTGFTNLNRIMQANAGNRLGQAVGGGVQQQAQQAKTSLQQAQQQFQQQSQAGRLDTEQNIQARQQALANLSQPVSPEQEKQFETFRAGRYAGPSGLQNQQQIQAQAQTAESMGRLGQTAGGREALLQRFVGGAGYTPGKSRLDTLLLGQGGAQALKQARRETAGLGGQAQQASTTAQEQAAMLGRQAQQFGQETKQQLAQAAQSEYDVLGQQAQTAETNRQAYVQSLKDRLKDPNAQFTQQEIEALGLKPGQNLYNTDLGQYVDRSNVFATRGNIASADDYAKAQALAKLSGQDITSTGQALLSELKDPTQAGQFAQSPQFQANQQSIKTAIENAQKDYQSALYDPYKQVQDVFYQNLSGTQAANPLFQEYAWGGNERQGGGAVREEVAQNIGDWQKKFSQAAQDLGQQKATKQANDLWNARQSGGASPMDAWSNSFMLANKRPPTEQELQQAKNKYIQNYVASNAIDLSKYSPGQKLSTAAQQMQDLAKRFQATRKLMVKPQENV